MQTEKSELLTQILDSLSEQIVFVDNDHIVRYVNSSAGLHYAKYGDLIGKSIFDCHNERSCGIIKDTWPKLENGAEEEFIYETSKHRVYMRNVRDSDKKLLGYYERYEMKR